MAGTLNKGGVVSFGLGGVILGTGYITEDATIEQIGEIKNIQGENGDTYALLVKDLGQRITVNAIVTSGTPTWKIGDALSINSIAGTVEKTDIKRERDEAKVSVTIVKYDNCANTAAS